MRTLGRRFLTVWSEKYICSRERSMGITRSFHSPLVDTCYVDE
jgi:hypothetical protein